MQSIKESIDKNRVPGHIAVIMDGNGRWAKQLGKNRLFGHKNGVKSVKNTVEACAEAGVKYLTLYAFSTENWQRPKKEISALMELLVSSIRNELKTLHENQISLKSIGDIDKLPPKCKRELLEAIEITKNYDRLNLVLALSYSSRWDILQAAKKLAIYSIENKINPDQIDETLFKNELTTSQIPDPELIIRTSGEQRISNFLLWEAAYAEFYFIKKNWPDFGKEDLYSAILDFQNRERRFGKISEQVKK